MSATASGRSLGKSCDNLPWYADLSYLYGSMQDRGMLEHKYIGSEGYLRFHQDLGAGICFYAPWLWSSAYTSDVTEDTRESDGIRTTKIKTPVGSVHQVMRYLPVAFTWAITEYYIKDICDLRIMRYACEHRKVRPNYQQYTTSISYGARQDMPLGVRRYPYRLCNCCSPGGQA